MKPVLLTVAQLEDWSWTADWHCLPGGDISVGRSSGCRWLPGSVEVVLGGVFSRVVL